jgi:hypothetical protein
MTWRRSTIGRPCNCAQTPADRDCDARDGDRREDVGDEFALGQRVRDERCCEVSRAGDLGGHESCTELVDASRGIARRFDGGRCRRGAPP